MARILKEVSLGSQGEDVGNLQRLLNDSGYNLKVDGIFGKNTLSAVKDWQGKNGLTVDGIVGNNTWGSLTGGTSGGDKTTTTKPFEYDDFKYDDFQYDDFKYDKYKESDTVNKTETELNAHLAQKPGEYQSQWQDQLNDTINKILNREKFSYDLNGDALYQQYKDKYIKQGKMAMGDAIGQASAMTGGYGNSYAQSVGQQAYQAQLENLNDIVPELYQMAYDKYNQEGQDLYNQYSMLGAQDDRDYGRHRDAVGDWQNERNYLAGRYDSERDYDYSKYVDDRNFSYGQYADDRNFAYGQYADDRNLAYGQYADDRTLAYGQYRDAIADEQWQKNFEAAQAQFDREMDLEEGKWDYTKTSSGGSSGGGSGSGSGSGGNGGGNGNGNTTGGTTTPANPTTGKIPEHISTQAGNYTTETGQANYLAGAVANGEITQEQAFEIMDANKIVDIKNRSWEMTDDGGVNWFWGSDNNAKVRDQYGNEYSIGDLKKELKKTMSNKEVNAYIKQLQNDLGI